MKSSAVKRQPPPTDQKTPQRFPARNLEEPSARTEPDA